MDNKDLIKLTRDSFLKVLVNKRPELISILNKNGFVTKDNPSNADLIEITHKAIVSNNSSFNGDLSELMIKENYEGYSKHTNAVKKNFAAQDVYFMPHLDNYASYDFNDLGWDSCQMRDISVSEKFIPRNNFLHFSKEKEMKYFNFSVDNGDIVDDNTGEIVGWDNGDGTWTRDSDGAIVSYTSNDTTPSDLSSGSSGSSGGSSSSSSGGGGFLSGFNIGDVFDLAGKGLNAWSASQTAQSNKDLAQTALALQNSKNQGVAVAASANAAKTTGVVSTIKAYQTPIIIVGVLVIGGIVAYYMVKKKK